MAKPSFRNRAVALPESLRRSVGFFAVFAALVVVILGLLYAGDSAPSRIDVATQSVVESLPRAHALALVVDFAGEPIGRAILVLGLVAVCLLWRASRLAVVAALAPAAAGFSTSLLKPLFGRTINGGFLAYPSGHTAVATALMFTFVLLIAVRFRLAGWSFFTLMIATTVATGATMGWSQVVLGSHYPTDALGGMCCALVIVPATAWVSDRVAGARAARSAGAGTR